MEILKYDEETADDLIKRSQADINQILNIVQDILSDVKENKDEAVKRYTAKFDKCELENLQVSQEEIKNAYENLDANLIEALKSASGNIKKFHKAESLLGRSLGQSTVLDVIFQEEGLHTLHQS